MANEIPGLSKSALEMRHGKELIAKYVETEEQRTLATAIQMANTSSLEKRNLERRLENQILGNNHRHDDMK